MRQTQDLEPKNTSPATGLPEPQRSPDTFRTQAPARGSQAWAGGCRGCGVAGRDRHLLSRRWTASSTSLRVVLPCPQGERKVAPEGRVLEGKEARAVLRPGLPRKPSPLNSARAVFLLQREGNLGTYVSRVPMWPQNYGAMHPNQDPWARSLPAQAEKVIKWKEATHSVWAANVGARDTESKRAGAPSAERARRTAGTPQAPRAGTRNYRKRPPRGAGSPTATPLGRRREERVPRDTPAAAPVEGVAGETAPGAQGMQASGSSLSMVRQRRGRTRNATDSGAVCPASGLPLLPHRPPTQRLSPLRAGMGLVHLRLSASPQELIEAHTCAEHVGRGRVRRGRD
ncbi:uncharacterized protein LOC142874908 [Microcebus murinus]|uniref:uncharacterized protein LOC142874908 n=1 Tax=Microcebus murinus TaxID=30608 RepID=UPI003F6AE31B